MMRERQTLQGALLGVIGEEGLHCLTHNQSTYDRQRREKQEWQGKVMCLFWNRTSRQNTLENTPGHNNTDCYDYFCFFTDAYGRTCNCPVLLIMRLMKSLGHGLVILTPSGVDGTLRNSFQSMPFWKRQWLICSVNDRCSVNRKGSCIWLIMWCKLWSVSCKTKEPHSVHSDFAENHKQGNVPVLIAMCACTLSLMICVLNEAWWSPETRRRWHSERHMRAKLFKCLFRRDCTCMCPYVYVCW